jgi:YD repeat-containing protein
MKRLFAAVLITLSAVAPAVAQKIPADELGFKPEKLYDFSNTDSVSLFNGNLIITIPIGIRYTVSPSLSYQFSLVYNGKTWDEERWCDLTVPGAQCGNGETNKSTVYANLRSNAGNGWRVSLGRLLPPYATSRLNDSLVYAQNWWLYEGPSGDEHMLPDILGGIRMHPIGDGSATREIEFGSGEIHRFDLIGPAGQPELAQWRLTQMRDRYNNAVNINYTYTSTGGEATWTVTDTATPARRSVVTLQNHSAMNDGWSRGQEVSSIDLQGAGGSTNRAVYSFTYAEDTWTNLQSLTLPDTSQYTFTGAPITRMRYPTGGTVAYEWGDWRFQLQDDVCAGAISRGVTSRTVTDGPAGHKWEYVQEGGVAVPGSPTLSHPCNPNDNLIDGPFYYSRTSVIAPADADGKRVRTDNYFSIFPDRLDMSNGTRFTIDPASVLPGWGLQKYSHPGTAGAPALAARAKLHGDFGPNVDASDSVFHVQDIGLLATETYDNCDATGDCTNGRLLRTTYHRYTGSVYPPSAIAAGVPGFDDVRLAATRTVFQDDTSACGTFPCYTRVVYSDDNGADQFRTTTTESNFPGSQTITATKALPTWTSALLNDPSIPWLLDTYTETTRTQGNTTLREQFCFDGDNGSLLRHRVLAGGAPGPHDVLQVFQYYPAGSTSPGGVQFAYDYGGDVQSVDTGSSLCSIPLSSTPWYKVENTYSNGVLSKSRYYDRTSNTPLSFYSFDRDIDPWTGVATASRDAAGVATRYAYDPMPARLKTMTSAAGAVAQYTYTPATGTIGSAFTPAQVIASTDAGKLDSRFVFDALGRVQRKMAKGPDAWTASETTYDEQGRVAWTSEAEDTGSAPPAGALSDLYKTTYSYDAFGRSKTVTAPDGSVTTFGYTGERVKTRTNGIWTNNPSDICLQVTGQHCTTVIEQYDGSGRLISVTEPSGATNATSKTGADVVTAYSYDAGGHLAAVKMTGGSVQNRIFDYDGRGFLRWESQPESSMAAYTYDARGHALSKTQSTANTQFDLNFTYDSAERLTRIDARNPLYDANNPIPQQPQFRPIKEITFGTANAGSDLRNGKLVTATRHNYGETIDEPEYAIQDAYMYDDVAGRLTARTTTITQIYNKPGWPTTEVQHITTGYDETQQRTLTRYDDLGQPLTVAYPMCIGCGIPPSDPDRTIMSRTYAAGRLKMLTNFLTDTTYWPNGLRHTMSHANGIVDTQEVASMARPSSIAFGTDLHRYDRCVQPVITTQPASADGSGGSVTLSVAVTGTSPFTYQWYDLTHSGVGVIGTTPTVTVSPTGITEYSVLVSNACGYVQSQMAKVTVGSCPAPTTGPIQAVAQPDGTWILKPNPEARQPRTYTWTRTLDNAVLGSSETLAVGILTATTTYRLTITDSCGSGTATVTINVPLPITSGLQATASLQPLQVALTWPSIAGASLYTIERRSLGGTWETAGTAGAAGFVDTTATAGRTYVYRVTSDNGGHTDYDVATLAAFTAAAPLTTITPTPLNSMLAAVNSVRAAAGWPAVTWSNVLSASDPLPQPGQYITARQIMACRARMNEALQALGVVVRPYTDPDLGNLSIKALYINEIEQRAQ